MGKRTESLQGPGWGGNPLARPPGGKAGTWQAFLHPTGTWRALGQMDREELFRIIRDRDKGGGLS